MNYCIQIESPVRSTLNIPFTRDVYRLGSGNRCEIEIPTQAPHAMTVFRRTASVFVLNRAGSPIQLGRSTLASGQTAEWRPNTAITVDGISLTLLSSRRNGASGASETPDRRPLSPVAPTRSSDRACSELPSAVPGTTRSHTSQAAVIVACLVMMALMLWLGSGVDSSSDKCDEQIHALSVALKSVASSKQAGDASHNRVERLLTLLAQYRIAVSVEEPSYANIVKSEARTFCESMVKAPGLSVEEHDIAKRMGMILGQIQ